MDMLIGGQKLQDNGIGIYNNISYNLEFILYNIILFLNQIYFSNSNICSLCFSYTSSNLCSNDIKV